MSGDSTWPEVRLGNLVKIEHGWAFKGELCSEELSGKPIVVNIGNFEYTGGFRFDTTRTREYRGDYPKNYELRPGDILLIMTCQTSGGEILGVPGRVPNDGRVYLHNQRMGKVAVKDQDRVDINYLYWLFLWPEFNRHLYQTASGTKILHTSPSRIEDFCFSLPPLPTQRRIAEILGRLDDKIEVNRRINRTLEEMAQALFKHWFVDFGPFQDGPFVESELGLIPEGWEVKSLDEIADFLNGLALQKFPPESEEDYLPVIKIAEMRRGVTETTGRASSSIEARYIVEDGDVLFSWSGSLLLSIWTNGPGALNQHLFKVTSVSYPKWFYYRWIEYHLPDFQAIAAGKATTMGHIQRYHLSDAKVVVPPPDILEAADKSLARFLNLYINNELEDRTLAATRDYLLPRLLSGEVTV